VQAIFHCKRWLKIYGSVGKFMNQGAELRHKLGKELYLMIGFGGIQVAKRERNGVRQARRKRNDTKRRRIVKVTEQDTKHVLKPQDTVRLQTTLAEISQQQAKGSKRHKDSMAFYLIGGHKVRVAAGPPAQNSAPAGGDDVNSIPSGAAEPAERRLTAAEAKLAAVFPDKDSSWHKNWVEFQVMRGLLTVNYLHSIPFCASCDSFECQCSVYERKNLWQDIQADVANQGVSNAEDGDFDPDDFGGLGSSCEDSTSSDCSDESDDSEEFSDADS
jgi:hypothetical protein